MSRNIIDNQSQANSSITVFDLGSSSVRAIVAQMTDRGFLRILGAEENTRFDAIEDGVVRNPSNAGFMIKETMRYLGNKTNLGELDKAFYVLGGRSTQVVPVVATVDLARKRQINAAVLKQLEQQCIDKITGKFPEFCVLALTPDYYDLDGIEQDETPTPDQRAMVIKAHFSVFVGKNELMERTEGSFGRANIQIEASLMRLDAQLTAFATEPDRQNGCAILDLGAQTTTIGIYKHSQFLYATVIPMGGDDVTEAIAALGCTMQIAEKIKCEYATALPEQQEKERKMRLPKEGGGTMVLTTTEVSAAIASELDRIFDLLSERISPWRERFCKIYLTGGACKLEGIADYIEDRIGIPVEYGCHEEWLEADTEEQFYEPQYAALVGALAMAYDYRLSHEPKKEKRGKKNIFDPLKDKMVNLFSPQEEQEL